MPDVCDRCGYPAIQIDGKWTHASAADGVFCDLVLGSKTRHGDSDAA